MKQSRRPGSKLHKNHADPFPNATPFQRPGTSNSSTAVAMISGIVSKILLLAGCLVTVCMLFLICVRYPDNHGAGPMMFRWLFLGIMIVAGVCMIWRNGFVLAALILAAIGFASTWVVDHRNIVVDYDIWIKRGMPIWGQLTSDDVSSSEENADQ